MLHFIRIYIEKTNICTINIFKKSKILKSYEKHLMKDGSKVSLAIQNSGGIRGSLKAGNVNLKQLITVVPFRHTFDVVALRGGTLRRVFEHSAALCGSKKGCGGQFLQVSSDFRTELYKNWNCMGTFGTISHIAGKFGRNILKSTDL